MRLARPLLLLMSIALAVPVAAFAADQYVPLQQRMSAEEFKAAGLDKLSPDELKNLDNWLSGHGKVVTKVVDQAGKPVFYPTAEKSGPVQARVQGAFAGLQRPRPAHPGQWPGVAAGGQHAGILPVQRESQGHHSSFADGQLDGGRRWLQRHRADDAGEVSLSCRSAPCARLAWRLSRRSRTGCAPTSYASGEIFQRTRQALGRYRFGRLQFLREQRHAPLLDQPAQFIHAFAACGAMLEVVAPERQYLQ